MSLANLEKESFFRVLRKSMGAWGLGGVIIATTASGVVTWAPWLNFGPTLPDSASSHIYCGSLERIYALVVGPSG